MGLVLVAAALIAICAEYVLSISSNGAASRPEALRFDLTLSSLDIGFAAAGSLFILLVWLAFHSRNN